MAHGASNNPGGGKPDKLIRDALMAAMRQSPHKLKKGAEAVLDKLEAGDDAAWRFVADRVDGKVTEKMELTGANGGAIETKEIGEGDKAILARYLEAAIKPKGAK